MNHSTASAKWVYLMLLSLIWGSSYILIKKGLTGFGYLEATTIRLVAAGLVCLPLGLYYGRRLPARRLGLVALSGLLGMLVPASLFSLAQQQLPSSVAGVLIATTPSFTFLISVLVFRGTYSRSQLLGVGLGLGSCFWLGMVAAPGTAHVLNPYVLLVLLATLCYGLNINLVKRYLQDVPPLATSTVSVALNGLLAYVFLALPDVAQLRTVADTNPGPLVALVVLGVAGTALAQLLHNQLIRISAPLFASTTTYLIPVVAIGWGVLDGEPVTALHVLASAGILASVYLIRKEQPAPPVSDAAPVPPRISALRQTVR